MKILYVDVVLNGHHKPYLKGLLSDPENNMEKVLLIPSDEEDFGVKKYEYKKTYDYRKVRDYHQWLSEVSAVVKKEKPDVIHFLYGDVLYRHFGTGLGILKGKKTIVTFHQFRRNKIVDISLRRLFGKISYGVVHTKSLQHELNGIGIKNVKHIEYPQLYAFDLKTKEQACEYWGLNPKVPVLGVIGETRYYKGFDILLEALKTVDRKYQLLIAGKEGYFDKAYIEKNIEPYKEKVTLRLKFLSDEELCAAIAACDYILLPYRKRFDGASGPLTEAVWARRLVVASDHGSLGDIVAKNKLGITFVSEDTQALSEAITQALDQKLEWNEDAEKYRETIKLSTFQCEYRKLYSN